MDMDGGLTKRRTSGSWEAGLSPDLLDLILDHLPLLTDQIRFSAVCTSWRSIQAGYRQRRCRPLLPLPLLVPSLSQPYEPEHDPNIISSGLSCFSPLEQRFYRLHALPDPSARWVGSSPCGGWLLLLLPPGDSGSPHTTASIFNPFSGARILLPPLPIIKIRDKDSFVGAIDDQRSAVMLARRGDLFLLKTTSSSSWIRLKVPLAQRPKMRPVSAIWAKGRFYCNFDDQALMPYCCDLAVVDPAATHYKSDADDSDGDGGGPLMVPMLSPRLIGGTIRPRRLSLESGIRLVESNGEVLLVSWLIPSRHRHRQQQQQQQGGFITTELQVFKAFNLYNMDWVGDDHEQPMFVMMEKKSCDDNDGSSNNDDGRRLVVLMLGCRSSSVSLMLPVAVGSNDNVIIVVKDKEGCIITTTNPLPHIAGSELLQQSPPIIHAMKSTGVSHVEGDDDPLPYFPKLYPHRNYCESLFLKGKGQGGLCWILATQQQP